MDTSANVNTECIFSFVQTSYKKNAVNKTSQYLFDPDIQFSIWPLTYSESISVQAHLFSLCVWVHIHTQMHSHSLYCPISLWYYTAAANTHTNITNLRTLFVSWSIKLYCFPKHYSKSILWVQLCHTMQQDTNDD